MLYILTFSITSGSDNQVRTWTKNQISLELLSLFNHYTATGARIWAQYVLTRIVYIDKISCLTALISYKNNHDLLPIFALLLI